MISVGYSALVVVALVFFLVLVLSSLFFEPLAKAMESRRDMTESAERIRAQTARDVEASLAKWREATGRARALGLQELEKARQEAVTQRHRRVDSERERALADMAKARDAVRKEGDAALRALEGEADRLAAEIASRLLGRQVA